MYFSYNYEMRQKFIKRSNTGISLQFKRRRSLIGLSVYGAVEGKKNKLKKSPFKCTIIDIL